MNPEILEYLESQGNRIFSARGSVSVGVIAESANPGSTTSRVEILIGSKRRVVYVKTLIPGRGASETIREDVVKEYEILKRLYEGFSGMTQVSVVRPIAVFPEYRAIATEEAPGPTLQHRLSGAATFWASAADAGRVSRSCYLAGKWLNRFQQLTSKGKKPFSTSEIMNYCDVRLDDLVAHSESRVDERWRLRIRNALDDMSMRAVAEENPVAGCHNDYAPHNMIAQDDHLYVLDLGFFSYDSTVYDVCRFWHRLETFKSDPRYSRRRLADCQKSFLQGYERRVDRTAASFRLAECRFVLSSMCTLLRPGQRSLVRRRFDSYLYRRYLRWLDRQCA